ncbi:MAG: sigma-54-dependent Fis family transcriptional regulator, partial [Kiritimatiellae bacterium]|nr:sigma-54-dependent Fis family transcriptional regulator [Kiritimatiellia bacterium]
RVGGTKPVKVDVRVICATNRDLSAEVKAGRFREDLYYRLNVIQIDLPPLRERPGDIAELVAHYVGVLGGPGSSVSPEAMESLCRYCWPGNVRELRNVVERMLVLGAGKRIEVGDLPAEIRGSAASKQPACEQSGASLAEIERRHIEAVLEACGGNKKSAAEKLGISRSTLYEKLKESESGRTECGHGESEIRTERKISPS